MRKAVLNMLATDWFEEEPKNYNAEDSSDGSSSRGGDSGDDSMKGAAVIPRVRTSLP